MNTQTSLSNENERIITNLIREGIFTVTDHISCYSIKRCDYCPLERKSCITIRNAYMLKHYPELHI